MPAPQLEVTASFPLAELNASDELARSDLHAPLQWLGGMALQAQHHSSHNAKTAGEATVNFLRGVTDFIERPAPDWEISPDPGEKVIMRRVGQQASDHLQAITGIGVGGYLNRLTVGYEVSADPENRPVDELDMFFGIAEHPEFRSFFVRVSAVQTARRGLLRAAYGYTRYDGRLLVRENVNYDFLSTLGRTLTYRFH